MSGDVCRKHQQEDTSENPCRDCKLEAMNTRVVIPDDAWENNGIVLPWSRLYARLEINGVHFHLEAIAIEEGVDGIQKACEPSFETNLCAIADVSEPDGNWDTMVIRGREYVVFATPYC